MTTIPHEWLKRVKSPDEMHAHGKNYSDTFKNFLDKRPLPFDEAFQEQFSLALQKTLAEEKASSLEEEKEVLEALVAPPLPIPFLQDLSAISSSGSIPPIGVEVFQEVVGSMHQLHTQGKSETTFFLDGPRFEGSAFFGSKVVIEEYQTAPKAFNVYLVGEPEAAALFRQYAPALMSTFQSGNFPFKINRLETHLFPKERFLVKRKEETKDQNL